MQKKFVILIIFIIILVNFYSVTSLKVYSLEKDNTSILLYHNLTRPGDKFTVKWIHSISRQPVIETYEITDDLKISIYEMIFNTNSPNLPAYPEGSTKWEIKDGIFRVYNYNTFFDELLVRIGMVISNHTLYFRDDEIVLKELYRPGGLVKIIVRKEPLLNYIREEAAIWIKKTNQITCRRR